MTIFALKKGLKNLNNLKFSKKRLKEKDIIIS